MMIHFWQALQHFDLQLFYWINLSLANQFFDFLMVFVTTRENWYIPGGIAWLYVMIKGGKRGRIFGVLIVLTIIFSDQISSTLLKPLIGRLRPCKALEGFRLLVHCGSKYGFPSSHATNGAAIATMFSVYSRKWTPIWILFAFFIGVSRIYVGVHYPSDVVSGWILGILISVILIAIAKRIFNDL